MTPQVSRDQIVAYRRRVNGLETRVPLSPASLRRAAWAGLQDSMPRAALLSIHARVAGAQPDSWADPALAQVWGPRFSAYVVPAQDVPVFTLSRMPDDAKGRSRAIETAQRLDDFLAGRAITYEAAGVAMGVNPNSLRYATATGGLLIRWEGARSPTVWMVPPPAIDEAEARREMARRFLHVLGPSTAAAFAEWAGIGGRQAAATFDSLATELAPVRTPVGDRWLLARDESALRSDPEAATSVRLLPSGDPYYLLQGADRELLVPDVMRRADLWTSRVWPGALLVGPEICGTWRRAGADVSVSTWRRLTNRERGLVEAEAGSLPLPDLQRPIRVSWLATD